LAKQALKAPLEIVIGGRAAASGTIKQFIEVREEGMLQFPFVANGSYGE